MQQAFQEIGKALIDAFGLPDRCRSIEIRCSVMEPVTIKCEIIPEGFDGDKIKAIVKEFELTPRIPQG